MMLEVPTDEKDLEKETLQQKCPLQTTAEQQKEPTRKWVLAFHRTGPRTADIENYG